MEELIKEISERTGISTDQSREAVQMVLKTLKERLPEQIGSQIEPMLNNPMAGQVINQAFDSMENLFGKKG